jgi:hypothetical protein
MVPQQLCPLILLLYEVKDKSEVRVHCNSGVKTWRPTDFTRVFNPAPTEIDDEVDIPAFYPHLSDRAIERAVISLTGWFQVTGGSLTPMDVE